MTVCVWTPCSLGNSLRAGAGGAQAGFFFFFFFGATFSTCVTKFGPQQLLPPTGTGRHRRDISVVLDGWWVRGAASARRQGPRAAQAHPQPHCTRRQVGVRRGARQMRAARQLRATPTNAQPKLTAPLAAALPERRRTCAAPTNVATWRLHCQSGHRPRPRRPPSGSAGRAQARRLRRAAEGPAGLHGSPWLRFASPGDKADDGGVNGLLRAMPQGKPVGNNFDAAVG